jgi:pSer/pThr/pTyr-binding forkhead associated (FHA) protein
VGDEDNFVSAHHLEIYAVVFEENGSSIPPLVYVRNRRGLNGTRLNGEVIARGRGVSAGRLLRNRDIIKIGTYLELHFLQKMDNVELMSRYKLNSLQYLEVQVKHPYPLPLRVIFLTKIGSRASRIDTS